MTSVRQSLIDHLKELRARLLWISLVFISASGVGYIIHKPLLALLTKPLNQPLFYTSPAGGFDFILKVCFLFGLLASVPIIVYHILKFIYPAIPQHARSSIIKYLCISTILMTIGISFAYFVSLPAALHFLNQFGTDQVRSLISTNEYFSFVFRYLIGFGILFQLPLFLLFINSITPLAVPQLMKQQKWIILASFILAAVITPTPDFFNQILMAFPIILLYQFAIVWVWVANRGRIIREPVLSNE